MHSAGVICLDIILDQERGGQERKPEEVGQDTKKTKTETKTETKTTRESRDTRTTRPRLDLGC